MLRRSLLVAVVAAFCLLALTPSTSADQSIGAGKVFERIFIIMFENHGFKQVASNAIWSNIMSKSRVFTNYFAVTHPSQPNYIATLAGDLLGCHDDNNIDIDATNLVDLLEAKHVSWRAYQEAYVPLNNGDCNPAKVIDTYYRKHNPFMSFNNIRTNITRCRNIVPATQLEEDVRLNKLPNVGYYTPDINNDSHNQDLDYSGKWLSNFLDTYMNQPNFSNGTLLFVTFDEDEYFENNRIATFLMGPYIKPGTSHNGLFNHYSLTRSIELNYGLANLGRNDVTAADFLDAIQGN